jgi:uncharacterized protein (TIGR02466 family)
MSALETVSIGEKMARPTESPPAGPQAAAGGQAPQLTLLNLFSTPLVIATMPDAAALNAELKTIILAREPSSQSVERSNHGGWQSTWDLHEWGGAPIQKVLAFGRAIAEQVTVDRTGNRRALPWRINCWANINRQGHGNQFHTHPGALWSASYYVDDGGVGTDASLGGEFEIQDPRGVAPIMYAPFLTFVGPDGPALGESQRLTPQAGMFVMFPAWLSHGVRPYRGTRERISIAINFSLG